MYVRRYTKQVKSSMHVCERGAALSCEREISVCPGIVPSLSSNICLPIGRMPCYLLIHCHFQIYASPYSCTGTFHSPCTVKRDTNVREVVLQYYNQHRFEDSRLFIYDSS